MESSEKIEARLFFRRLHKNILPINNIYGILAIVKIHTRFNSMNGAVRLSRKMMIVEV